MRSTRLVGTFYTRVFPNSNYVEFWFEARNEKSGKPSWFNMKRRYKENRAYHVYVKKNRVVKTKLIRPKKLKRKDVLEAMKWAEENFSI